MNRRVRTRFVLIVLLGVVLGIGVWLYFDPPLPRDEVGLRYDPVEDDPKAQPSLRAADQEATEWTKQLKHVKGTPLAIEWESAKKRILREKYGIRWRSRRELNPDRSFD